jgi:Carboxypeptidase regulatory-like domain
MAVAMAILPLKNGHAWIRVGKGNAPVADPGWPKGAAKIFNDRERVAWWEGPPFGGGQWHAECRGNAQVLNAVLDDFVNIDAKAKRVIVHDGVGQSFGLNSNREPAKRAAAEIDWEFTVWQRASWEQQRKLPVEYRPPDFDAADKEPPVQIDIYVGGKVHWSELLIPHGLEVIDERLEAHGFTSADRIVLEGKVFDLASKKPLTAALRLDRIDSKPGGGLTKVLQTVADPPGHWVMKKVPEGWYRLVAEKEGYVPRLVAYTTLDVQPGWHHYACGLAPVASLSGRVTDETGKPLADVAVRLSDILPAGSTGGYQLLNEKLCKTNADGRFQSDQVPAGKATIWLHKAGYILRGLGPQISIPAKDLVFKLERSAQIRVTVAFPGGERPSGYQVEIDAEGGRAVGQWGGSGDIDQQNQIVFSDMPPGRYILQGHPNPFTISRDKRSKPVTIDVKGGQSAEITLSAD